MAGLSQQQHRQAEAPRKNLPPAGVGGAGGQSRFGNAFLQAKLKRAPEPTSGESEAPGGSQAQGGGGLATGGPGGNGGDGPFAGWLNEALSLAFGRDLRGLAAGFGEQERNAALGAEAHTEGRRMSFNVGSDPQSLDELGVIAHEAAHALAGGGSGQTTLDTAGDAGERAADQAAAAFRQWAEGGFLGAAPRLVPAFGGRAKIHRASSNSATVTGDPMLRYGSTGSLVSALQSLLNAKDNYRLEVDGIFGRHTDAAVRDFQGSHGLEVDGVVGPKTAAKLNSGSSSSSSSSNNSGSSSSSSSSGTRVTGNPMLRKGSRGSLVSTLQGLLNGFGGRLAVDGDFGSLTDQAVRGFQSANRLEVDGIVGPVTADKLYDSDAKDISSSSSSSSSSGGGSGETYAGNGAYDDMRDAVLAAARSHLGAPYYWGADGPSMFDCSGFVLYVLREDTGLINWGDDTAGGIKNRLPRTSSPQPGDLNFYTGSSGVSHVEMFTGNGTQEIGASGGGSSTYGNDPDAKVQYSDSSDDSRSLSHGSIQGLIDATR